MFEFKFDLAICKQDVVNHLRKVFPENYINTSTHKVISTFDYDVSFEIEDYALRHNYRYKLTVTPVM